MAIKLNEEALDRAFDIPEMSYDEYRAQDVFDTRDGEFFDALDEAFGIVPRTDKLVDEQ